MLVQLIATRKNSYIGVKKQNSLITKKNLSPHVSNGPSLIYETISLLHNILKQIFYTNELKGK